MNHVGLFSGIGGFELAFRRAGAQLSAVCEIDPLARRVLRRHFTDAEVVSDVKEIRKDSFASGSIDVLTGGFPCQDLSVAGRRAGLAGERSGLWFEFIRIIADHKPRWVVIENVPGLLSSNRGQDFAVILRGLVECGYGIAWRILDAQYDGLAQRRERVFIVASFGDRGRAAEVLFEREGGGWDSAPSREAGEEVAGNAVSGAVSSKRAKGSGGPAGDECYNLVAASPAGSGDGVLLSDMRGEKLSSVVADMRMVRRRPARDGRCFGLIGSAEYAERLATLRSQGGDCGGGSEHLIAHTLRAEGSDASEDGTGRGTPLVVAPNVAATLNSDGNNGGFRTEPGAHLVAFSSKDYGNDAAEDVAPTLRSMSFDKSHINGGGQVAIAFTERSRADGRNFEAQEELVYALTNPGSGGRTHSRQIAGQFGVRRLTPTECEILQGFPRGWTATGADGKAISDSARYRMLGNAVAVPTVEWIARRIMQVK